MVLPLSSVGARRILLAGFALVASMIAPRLASAQAVATHFDPDGTAHVQNLTAPLSPFESEQAKAAWIKAHSGAASGPPPGADLPTLQAFYGRFNDRLAARMKAIYPVDIEARTIGGVRTEIVRPKGGVAPGNAHRILINLHGGGFLWGEGSGGEVEAVPIASVGKIAVVTVAYREAPEHRFPAGSEDVAAVYRALLADHRPSEIGIYGCSAGGVLTAESVAWIVTHGLPAPGAIGTFCGSAAPMIGDSMNIMPPLGGEAQPTKDGRLGPYFEGADLKDPMVAPTNSDAVLAKFPPTLLLAGSRDFAASSLFYAQRRLTVLGIDAELHIWDGLPHAFFVDPDLPESREVYDVVVKFFDRHLARRN